MTENLTQPDTEPTTGEGTAPPEIVPLTWTNLVDAVTAAGAGVFLATAGADGRPHVAYVMPGWDDERMWISIFGNSQKATNLRHCTAVAMTCDPSLETNVLIRATARLVNDPAETARLWDAKPLPYDPSMFFAGPEDPLTQFVELVPTHASIRPMGPGPVRRWHSGD